MRREIKRLEIKEGIHLEGVGIITSVLPMSIKAIKMRMFYDSVFPSFVIVEAKGNTHFISVDNVKSGTFDDSPSGNVL